MENKLPYLNLGCGNRYIKSWTNVDFLSTSEFVIQHDLNKGIPLNDNSFAFVYHSHVLEHFAKGMGENFIQECYRVLQPGAVIRIVIPDLEQLARQYLDNLDKAILNESVINNENYNWAVIELFDQMIRNDSGGEMAKYWTRKELINENYIAGRVGYEFKNFRHQFLESLKEKPSQTEVVKNQEKSLIARAKSRIKKSISSKNEIDNNPRATKIGEFRSSGEIHQWMYDRYSLKQLLIKIGFKDVKQVNAFTSALDNWKDFMWLDVENGEVRKPDSLFMEAVK